MALILLAAFILVPLAEIALFIEIGGRLGLWPTLALILLTAAAGAVMIRLQGFAVIGRVRHQLDQGVLPVADLFAALCLLAAGALLLTPGFLTDALGALLLVPPVRGWLYRRVEAWIARRKAEIEAEERRRRQGPGPMIEDVPYEEVERRDDELPPPGGGWSRR